MYIMNGCDYMKNKLIIVLLLCILLCGCSDDINDNKYVYQTDENIQYVFYYENETVTDFKIYVNFFDNETANNSLEQYKKTVESDTNIEDVTVDGKYIVIDYKKGYVKQNFGTDSLSVIKSMTVTDESN